MSEGLPLVSIVTPSLNQRQFIEATIESVLTQDYPRIEYIVIDGGSTDGTVDVLRRYEGCLEWVSEPDRGQSHAINKGFRRARGQILAWLNADDTYLPGAVTLAATHLVQHPACAMVYGDGYLIDEGGTVRGKFPATEPFNLWKLVYVIDYILQQTAFFRREVLDAVGDLDERLHWGMDWDLFIRIGKHLRVDYLARDMANLREHRLAKTLSGGRARLRELLQVMRRHGSRRYPPAYFVYGIDTYFQAIFEALEEALPRPLVPSLLRMRRRLERPAYGLAMRICQEAQGLYPDGWISRRAHFLLGASAANVLRVRGAMPVPARQQHPLRVTARVNGVAVGGRTIDAPGDFEAVWELPAELRQAHVVEVELTCTPTFVPAPALPHGDRRRLGFQLKTMVIA
jgi:hypothetical protein